MERMKTALSLLRDWVLCSSEVLLHFTKANPKHWSRSITQLGSRASRVGKEP